MEEDHVTEEGVEVHPGDAENVEFLVVFCRKERGRSIGKERERERDGDDM